VSASETIPALGKLRVAELREERKRSKLAWLEEGRELGAGASVSCWAVGEWLVKGERAFLEKMPTKGGKKALRAYYARRGDEWLALIKEASEVTNLTETTLRQYARVVRNGVKMDGLPFAHHIEAQRAHYFDEKGKRHFDANGAWCRLQEAKEQGWSVARMRTEMQSKYPIKKDTASTVSRMVWQVKKTLAKLPVPERFEALDALAEELQRVRSNIQKEVTVTTEELDRCTVQPELGFEEMLLY